MAQVQNDINITIRPRCGTIMPSFVLMVQVPNVVGNIRLRVSRRLQIAEQHLRLTLGGTPLHDNDPISHHNDGDTIEVMVRAGGGPMRSNRKRPRALGGSIRAKALRGLIMAR
ncbi:hypothetical protein MBLNU13_g09756t1 [Cladosporium sp. NU13]